MSLSPAVMLTPTIVHPSTNILLPDVLSKYGCVSQGGLLSCGTVAWVVFENSLIVIDAVSGKTIQSWLPPPEAGTIFHVSELNLGSDCQPLLVVGLEQNGCGVVVVLSPNTTKLLRAFEVPESITSIHPLSSSVYASFVDGYCLPDLFQDSALAYFSGVVAIGCQGGKVYLVNLHLNLEDELGQRNFCKLCLIQEDASGDDVHSIGESGRHVCVQLTQGEGEECNINL